MDATAKRTPLYDRHRALGARMTVFAGWELPLEYQGTLAEHTAVRTDLGVFDVSHLGTVWVTGPGAADTVARTVTRDVTRLPVGRSAYALCCTEDGGILDDLIVYRVAADQLLVVPNAANTTAVVGVLEAEAGDAEVADRSVETATIAIQGPRALDVAGRLLDIDAAALRFGDVTAVTWQQTTAWVARTGYTGERGVEVVLDGAVAATLFDAVCGAGAVPCGLGARDSLRLEMGYPLHGQDIGPDTDPYEARLGWAVELDRAPFRGQAALRERAARPPRRRLWGLRATERRGVPRAGMPVRVGERTVGRVTSGGFSPLLRVGIALAYLDDPVGPDTSVAVDVRGRLLTCDVVRPPFVDRDPRR